jgi:hypothetical protein
VKDKAKLPAWLREAAHEIESAHRACDALGVPDAADDGTPISLALRIAVLADPANMHARLLSVLEMGRRIHG